MSWVSVCERSLACAFAWRFAHSCGFEVRDFRAVLVRLGSACASGVLRARSRFCLLFFLVCLGSACANGVWHSRVLGASSIPLDLKVRISARYLYDLGQLVRVESCMGDLGFAF
jgi:hypothetical protein